jgi:hypothetical protein
MWSLPNRQKLETAGTVLRLVGNEKAKYALRDLCVLAADEMSLLIDQCPRAFFIKPTSKKPSKAALGLARRGGPASGNIGCA